MKVFLYAPDDFKNLCVIARSLECLGFRECHIFDPHRLIRPAYGKSYTRRIQTVSAGAFFLVRWTVVEDPVPFLRAHSGRRLAALPDQKAASLFGYEFLPSDMVVFGSERRGIPSEIHELCDLDLTIPLSGRTPSLNLAAAVSIFLAEMTRGNAQTG